MKQLSYSWLGIMIAIAFWVFDSSVHFLFFDEKEFEWIPTEVNELWMRSTIVFLIAIMGILIQRSSKNRLLIEHEKLELQKELTQALAQQLKSQRTQTNLTKETVLQMHDIINNFLNSMLLFRIQAEDSKPLSAQSLELFDKLIHDASGNIRELGETIIQKSSGNTTSS